MEDQAKIKFYKWKQLIRKSAYQWSTGGKIPAGAGEQLFSRGWGNWFWPGLGQVIFGQYLEPSPTFWSYEIIWK